MKASSLYDLTIIKSLCKMTRSFDYVEHCFTSEWALQSFQVFPFPLSAWCVGLNEVPVANFWLRNVESNVESPIQGVVFFRVDLGRGLNSPERGKMDATNSEEVG